jgi:hypothetical protein
VHGRPGKWLPVPVAAGVYDVAIEYRGPKLERRDVSTRVFLVPGSARRVVRERGRDAALSRRLASLGNAFPGYAGLWLHDLRTGRTAGWNSDASFPAASMVKLGVLVAALDRFGAEPRDRRIAKEMLDLVVWSSNDASNRLIVRLGGSERAGSAIVTATLHRLGATSSTFSGFYRLGTSVESLDAPRPPPLITYRRTTAHDIGRILFELHSAALGNGSSLRLTRLTRHEASVALGMLLRSDPRGPNVGLFRPALRGVPMAQKHGWTASVRHSGAIVYALDGPRIAVVLTYRPGLSGAAATALGGRIARLATGWRPR